MNFGNQPLQHRLKLDYFNALGASFVTEGNKDIENSLIFLDDNKLVYPVGHHIALRTIQNDVLPIQTKNDRPKVSFLHMPEGVVQITCMRLTPNKKYLYVSTLCRPNKEKKEEAPADTKAGQA